MKNYRIAWRNLWRNKRRTLITVGSVFFALFFALILRSLQLGSYDHMFKNVIESYTGYIQVQNEEFKDNSVVDNAFEFTPEIQKTLMANKNISDIIPRFESFALASSGALTKGVLVLGIDPEKEALLSNIKERLVCYKLTASVIDTLKRKNFSQEFISGLELFRGEGYSSEIILQSDLGISDRDATSVMPVIKKTAYFANGYISAGKQEALVGDKLAKFLKVDIGDTLILLGQGFHGTTAAGKFVIAGIVRMPTSDIDNKIVYLPVDVCREFYNASDMMTSVVLSVKDNSDKAIKSTIRTLGQKIPLPLRLIGWREMNELLISQMDADDKSGRILIGVLYLIITFGIFGTVLMMTIERKREFGVLVAIGMQKSKLAAVISVEMFYIGLLGIISGIAAALPVIIYGQYHPMRLSGEYVKIYESYGMEPIMPFMPVDNYFIWQSGIVSLIVVVSIFYPLRKIYKMKVVNSLRA